MLSIKKSLQVKNVFFALLIILFNACSSEKPKDADAIDESTKDTTEENSTGLQQVFYFIPSSLQAVSILKKADITYDESILNNPQNAAMYSSSFSKSLNLGVYSADLAYVTMFDKPQSSINYLKVVKQLSDGMGLSSIFETTELVERFKENINNKDSISLYISDLYNNTDTYLKESERQGSAALILTGGWVECLFLSTRLSEKNTKLTDFISDQRFSLENLIMILSIHENEEGVPELISDLKDLKEDYDKIFQMNMTKKDSTQNKDVTILPTSDELKPIREKVDALRNKIINKV